MIYFRVLKFIYEKIYNKKLETFCKKLLIQKFYLNLILFKSNFI